MSFARTLFVAIDYLYNAPQNNTRYTRFKNVDFIVNKDIVYDESAPDVCKLDTYCVKREGKYPVLFYIHGGGFVAGDKKYRRGLSRWSAEKGYFVINVNYGLCPQYKFPEPLRHIVAAANWMVENAEKLNLDLNRVIVSGDSAGGYYSAMLAVIAANKQMQERLGVKTDVKFQGAILNCGIYDVGTALQAKVPFKLTDKILWDFAGIKKEQVPTYEWLDFCAPINFVDASFPASFITYADQDFFCGGQGPRLIEKLQGLGVHVEEFHSLKFMENHCFSLTWGNKAARKNNELTADFMKRFAEGKV